MYQLFMCIYNNNTSNSPEKHDIVFFCVWTMYSIVFGGFSAESLQSRILDGKLYLYYCEVCTNTINFYVHPFHVTNKA